MAQAAIRRGRQRHHLDLQPHGNLAEHRGRGLVAGGSALPVHAGRSPGIRRLFRRASQAGGRRAPVQARRGPGIKGRWRRPDRQPGQRGPGLRPWRRRCGPRPRGAVSHGRHRREAGQDPDGPVCLRQLGDPRRAKGAARAGDFLCREALYGHRQRHDGQDLRPDPAG